MAISNSSSDCAIDKDMMELHKGGRHGTARDDGDDRSFSLRSVFPLLHRGDRRLMVTVENAVLVDLVRQSRRLASERKGILSM